MCNFGLQGVVWDEVDGEPPPPSQFQLSRLHTVCSHSSTS
jgi:hypothetical protein